MKCSKSELDSILVDIGEFGRYQRYVIVLISFLTVINYFSMVIYIFEATSINHRCKIPECDQEALEYNASWVINAVPYVQNRPSRCTQFLHYENTTCESSNFNSTVLESCDSFIYETSEISIMHDFNLHCDENVKLLSMIGTINGIGKFVGLPVAGYFSDRIGRKSMLVCCAVFSGIFGMIRSFSTTYTFFIIFEFLDSFCMAGLYACSFVLVSELAGPEKRPLISFILFTSYAIGGMTLGTLAWLIQSWRILLRVVYFFYFLILSYYWLLPESVRWLLAKKREEEALSIIRKVAKVNKREISEGKLETLISTINVKKTDSLTLRDLFGSVTLTIRCAICSFCWMSFIFVYYGLSITSTTLSGNRYLDFILVSAVEIPAYATSSVILKKLGRKISIVSAFALSTISCIAYVVLPIDSYWVKLSLYLFSKFGVAIAVPSIYMITNEMFPTSLRQTLLSVCSMFGRIGNIFAPQLFSLIEVWKYFPLVLFATFAGVSGILTLFLPETKNDSLPDTIEEAENLGKKSNAKP